ncbi:MAG: glycosyltransferase [Candidatus Omnitrophica bacterium]|nr:glycosyltransferase [Candidatus Omnitrophota bacterium]
MKILHLISSGGFFGAEQVLLSLGKALQQQGNDVVVGALNDLRDPHLEIVEQAQKAGIETVTFDSRGRIDFKTIATLRKYLKENNIEVLHTHNYKSNLVGMLAAKASRTVLVATVHGYTDMTKAVSFYEKVDRFVINNFFDRVVGVARSVFGKNLRPCQVVVPNGLDVDAFHKDPEARNQIRSKYAIQENDFLVGTVGRLSPEKNQKLLLQAIKDIAREKKNVRVMIVGSGSQEQLLKDFVRTEGLDSHVIFTGFIEDLAAYYNAMDLFVLPSNTEGIPMTLLEAMACQCPVVATSVGGVPGILKNGKAGRLVKPQNLNELKQSIVDLINSHDERQHSGKEGSVFVAENYSLSRMDGAYKEIYNEVLKK